VQKSNKVKDLKLKTGRALPTSRAGTPQYHNSQERLRL
jgi:hypothetical protein